MNIITMNIITLIHYPPYIRNHVSSPLISIDHHIITILLNIDHHIVKQWFSIVIPLIPITQHSDHHVFTMFSPWIPMKLLPLGNPRFGHNGHLAARFGRKPFGALNRILFAARKTSRVNREASVRIWWSLPDTSPVIFPLYAMISPSQSHRKDH